MSNEPGEREFDNCVICQIWLPVKKGPDGQSYCSLHLPRKLEESINKNKAKTGIRWLDWFRKIIDSNPV